MCARMLLHSSAFISSNFPFVGYAFGNSNIFFSFWYASDHSYFRFSNFFFHLQFSKSDATAKCLVTTITTAVAADVLGAWNVYFRSSYKFRLYRIFRTQLIIQNIFILFHLCVCVVNWFCLKPSHLLVSFIFSTSWDH